MKEFGRRRICNILPVSSIWYAAHPRCQAEFTRFKHATIVLIWLNTSRQLSGSTSRQLGASTGRQLSGSTSRQLGASTGRQLSGSTSRQLGASTSKQFGASTNRQFGASISR